SRRTVEHIAQGRASEATPQSAASRPPRTDRPNFWTDRRQSINPRKEVLVDHLCVVGIAAFEFQPHQYSVRFLSRTKVHTAAADLVILTSSASCWSSGVSSIATNNEAPPAMALARSDSSRHVGA